MEKFFFTFGALLAAVAVASGAFGAHGLQEMVSMERLEVWETAVRYHMLHALALMFVATAIRRWPRQLNLLRMSGFALLGGILLFSGSLYLLVLTDSSWLGGVTPLGGLAFIGGWLLLALAVWRA